MKEPYIEGVATHDDPESCVDSREACGEALTGAQTGRDIEPRKQVHRSADVVMLGGRPHAQHRYREVLGDSARSKTPSTSGTFSRENREIPLLSVGDGPTGRTGKADSHTPVMYGQGKSDEPVVPTKSSNKAARAEAEMTEGRGPAKGNANQQTTVRTQSREAVHDALERVRRRAERERKAKFTALLHHITIARLRMAFSTLKPDASAGVDGVTWHQYAGSLEVNLRDLHGRVHRGAYRAQPSRRAFIPKTDGGQRPLGIASLEDKIVQRALVEVLNAIYEVDFLGFSYGFRPGRSQHRALDALAYGIKHKRVNWVFDSDIRGFFDAIDHGWMLKFLEHRVADTRVLHLVQKWLKAGVLVDGVKTVAREGSPQGATISPLLANIYLHYVFDLWAHQWRARHARREMIIIRYADDIVVGFASEYDGRRFWADMSARLKSFELELHQDKTRMLRFGRYAVEQRAKRGQRKPETFDFLGFTHICGKTKSGGFQLVRHTIKRRMTATLKAMKDALRRRIHLPIHVQGHWLQRRVHGYYQYFAVPTNIDVLCSFRTQVERLWLRALRRRSQRHNLTWARMHALSSRWLPCPRLLHDLPDLRFIANIQGKSPVR